MYVYINIKKKHTNKIQIFTSIESKGKVDLLLWRAVPLTFKNENDPNTHTHTHTNVKKKTNNKNFYIYIVRKTYYGKKIMINFYDFLSFENFIYIV